MTIDLVIRGGQLVSPEQTVSASIAIDGGVIVAIGHDELMPPAREELRADGLHVLPGAIDSHVHFRDPGYPHKETWQTGSAAAACGGVTTVFEMPNTNPPTGTVEALKIKLRAAESSYVDFGIHGLFDDDTIDRLEELFDAGVTSFKAFVGNTFGNLPAPADGALLEGFEILAPLGIRTVVHPENSSIMARREARLKAAGHAHLRDEFAARPHPGRPRGAVRAAAHRAAELRARVRLAGEKMPLLWPHAVQTLMTTLAGFALGVGAGILIGLLIGSQKTAYDVAYPLLVGFSSIPKVAVVPIFVVWFGAGTVPAILTSMVISVFPVVVNVATGLASTEPELEDVLKVLRASKRDVLWNVSLPRGLPFLLASLKIAITLAFVGTVLSETVAVSSWIEGRMTDRAQRKTEIALT